MSSLLRCLRGSNLDLEGGTKFDSQKHPKNARSMAHHPASCLTSARSKSWKNLARWSTENGSFWRTGLESCALRPLSEEETRTESKVITEGGSKKLANHLRLPMMLEADLKA